MLKAFAFFLIVSVNLVFADTTDSLLNIIRKEHDNTKKSTLFFKLAETEATTGNYKNAINFLKLSYKFNPHNLENNINILIKAAHYYVALKNYEKARNIIVNTKKLLTEKSNDSLSLDLYNVIAYMHFTTSEFDSAIYYFEKCVEFSKLIKDTSSIATNYNNLSVCFYYKGLTDSALFYSKKALNLKLKFDSENYKGLAYGFLNVASYYDVLGNNDKALNNYVKALKYARKSDDNYLIITILNNIGSSFLHLENYNKAIEYFKKAYHNLETINNDRLNAIIFNNLGLSYLKSDNLDSAEIYFNKAVKFFKKLKHYEGLSAAYGNLGSIYLEKNNLDLVKIYLTKSLEYAKKANSTDGIISTNLSWGKYYYKKRNYREAIKNLKHALELSKKTNNKLYILDIYKYLARSFAKIESADSTSFYYEKFVDAKDSLLSAEKEKIARKIEAQYQTQLKEREIKNLKQANAIKELKLKKTKQRNLFIQIFLLGIVAFVILLIRKNKIKFENKIIEFKQKLLRSQMNPHFIFNALTTIQNFLSKKDCNTAMSALSKFASLMRQIIENSREEFVSLREELNTVRNYLEIQKLRKKSFEYEIEVDESIDVDEVEVPPMLLQPFIENSIKHAFPVPSEENKILVKLEKYKDGIVYSVVDNGIGVNKSLELKNKERSNHKSYAIEITKERLKLLYSRKKKIRFEISDLQKIDRNLQGTLVKFYLPLN